LQTKQQQTRKPEKQQKTRKTAKLSPNPFIVSQIPMFLFIPQLTFATLKGSGQGGLGPAGWLRVFCCFSGFRVAFAIAVALPFYQESVFVRG
jgi:hypothetical protein